MMDRHMARGFVGRQVSWTDEQGQHTGTLIRPMGPRALVRLDDGTEVRVDLDLLDIT